MPIAQKILVVPTAQTITVVPAAQTVTMTPAAHHTTVIPTGHTLVVPATFSEPAHPPVSPSYHVGPPGISGMPAGTAGVDFNEPRTESCRFWVRTDYLLWHVRNAPVSIPLVSTNLPPAIGALDEPGTTILFGTGSEAEASFGRFSGGRITVGGWLEKDHEYSWECSGFLLERRPFVFNAMSAGGDAPVVSIPFRATEAFNPPLNPTGETSLNAGGAPTLASVQFASQLFGAELNELIYVSSSPRFSCAVLLGFRYLDLNENMTLSYTNFDVTNSGTVVVTDRFRTHNHFYGAQIGIRLGLELGRWSLDTAATVAAGPMPQSLNIAGNTTVSNGAFGLMDGTTQGGVFAEPSNIGTYRRTVYPVMSELSFKVGFALTSWLHPQIAYSGLYMTSVARPGNQLDRNINPTQNAFFVPPGTLTGTPAPVVTNINKSDFWAHGLQIGLAFRY